MSPFTLLSLSADSLHPYADAPREAVGCGSHSERRWALRACAATFSVLALVWAVVIVQAS